MYLLDTNICIYLIKKHPANVISTIKTKNPFDINLSSITIAELEYGAAKSYFPDKNRITLLNFASPFEIISFTDSDARYFGEVRAFLEKSGKTIGPYDLQIAAQALNRNLILVTNNEIEFKRVPELQIENWI